MSVSYPHKHAPVSDTSGICSLFWHPVVFSFSFTQREELAGAWDHLQKQLEQLDIKYISDYDIDLTTHYVNKKRNTAKGLQALINGKYIVMESFLEMVVQVATAEEGKSSLLEEDFEGNWPYAIDFLPPRGEEMSHAPVEKYEPDPRRKNIFDGYTVVFYDESQSKTLHPVIANGKGKAVLKAVTPGETPLDEFIRFVKDVAGEKGLGEFEDGSEGKGVLVVKSIPQKGDYIEWWMQFAVDVALRLDQRLVDQKEFLDIILAVEPARLRRQLEVEPEPARERSGRNMSSTMDVDDAEPEVVARPPPRTRRTRAKPIASRFKGFDADMEDDDEETPAAQTQAAANAAAGDGAAVEESTSSQLKRPAPMDILEEIAPNANAAKRRRIEAGEDPIPPAPSPEPESDEEVIPESPQNKASKTQAVKSQTGRKKKEVPEDPILDQAAENARKKREEAEQRAAANAIEGDIDFADLRRLTLVESVSIRAPPVARTREQDIADGKWDPRWNGLQNFKKFQRRGHAAGRPAQKVIIGLKATKTKEYGLSEDYWLKSSQQQEDDSSMQNDASASMSVQVRDESMRSASGRGKGRVAPLARRVVMSDSDSSDAEEAEDQEMSIEPEMSRTKAGKSAEKANSQRRTTQTTTSTLSQSQTHSLRGKRPAANAPPARAPPAKKTRATRTVQVADSEDDSDDELKFKFSRRR